jgi:hypothetical protein
MDLRERNKRTKNKQKKKQKASKKQAKRTERCTRRDEKPTRLMSACNLLRELDHTNISNDFVTFRVSLGGSVAALGAQGPTPISGGY